MSQDPATPETPTFPAPPVMTGETMPAIAIHEGEVLAAGVADNPVAAADERIIAEGCDRINTLYDRSVESIFEMGRILIDIKAKVEHGRFTEAIDNRLRFSADKAHALMNIAKHPLLTKPEHVPVLPNSWGTLEKLTQMRDDELERGFREKLITPHLARNRVKLLLEIANPSADGVGRVQKPRKKTDSKPKPKYAVATIGADKAETTLSMTATPGEFHLLYHVLDAAIEGGLAVKLIGGIWEVKGMDHPLFGPEPEANDLRNCLAHLIKKIQ